MSNILIRTIAGAFFVIAIIGSIFWGALPFAILFLVFSQMALYEYFRMLNGAKFAPIFIFAMIASVLVYLIITPYFSGMISIDLLIAGFIAFIVIFIFGLFSKSDHAFDNIARSVLGVVYIIVPFALLNYFFYIKSFPLETSPMFLLGFFVIQWVYDIFAYLFGKYFGKNKLFERISPKKTWEGFIGGTIIALIVSLGVNYILIDLGWMQWMIITSLIIVFGTLGDLSVSMIKRHFNVKDTGKIIPGHGGVLDRFDSILFSAPVVFLYFYLVL